MFREQRLDVRAQLGSGLGIEHRPLLIVDLGHPADVVATQYLFYTTCGMSLVLALLASINNDGWLVVLAISSQ